MADTEKYRVSLHHKLAYAAPAFALAVVGIPVYVYIPKFYTDVVGIDIAILGVIMLSVRLFDAVTDPIIGYASDRTRTRFGRRRPYLVLGSVLLAVAMFLLFNPPATSIPNTVSVSAYICCFFSGQRLLYPSNRWGLKLPMTITSEPRYLGCAMDF